MTSHTHRVAVIGGDGIGPEVTAAALSVVAAAGVELATTSYDLGAARYLRDGFVLDDATLEELRGFDAILLGAIGPAIGDTRIPGGVLERGLLLKMRFGLDLYVNYRPFHGVAGSIGEGCAFAIVRENTEGPYAGEGGTLRRGSAQEIATQGSVNTRFGVERCVRYAFERASALTNPRLTLVHKTNVLTFAGDLWSRVVAEVGREYPSVVVDYNHVDAACIYLVENPGRYGVIVTDNLFGDILSDLAGAVTGGIGYAASANLNPARTGASMFEPVHGAAHDIVGTGRANPLAAVSSAALMLEHLGESEAARRLSRAVADFDGDVASLGTAGITAQLIERL
ncbi:MAG: 3-isopropylmalate dehydrogenase [Acidobacteriota bacterium]|nr:3-isopropylmalate dehydrogenase [Acidobacteriota bacterium]